MKVLIVDTYYPRFLASHYRQNDLAALPYAEQRRRLLGAGFGVADYYSRHLAANGVAAEEIVANCAPLQLQWARENYRPLWSRLPARLAETQLAARLLTMTRAHLLVVAEQVRRARPDVLYLQDLNLIPPGLLRSLRSVVKLVVGRIASPLPPRQFLEPYDLVLTSFPHYVSRLRDAGTTAEYFRLGFESSVLERVGPQVKRYPCTFVGGVSADHARGTAFLEYAAKRASVDFLGYGAETLPKHSAIRARHHGPAWAFDMYRALAQSHITLNRHVDVAENYANNMRLYEATGMGAMLLTDAKSNLRELFAVGSEVVAYDSVEDAAEKIRYYNEHPTERDTIARAGPARTLKDRTYERRMHELAGILARHLRGR